MEPEQERAGDLCRAALQVYLRMMSSAVASLERQRQQDRARRVALVSASRHFRTLRGLGAAAALFAVDEVPPASDEVSLAWLGSQPGPRRCWVKRRLRRGWWSGEVLATWGEDMWLRHFRMTRATLFDIAERLRPHLQRARTVMREPVSVEERVAVAVWWLTRPLCYKKTANAFGLGIATVAEIAIEVCLAVQHLLLPSTVCLRDPRRIMAGFEEMGFPQCVGVVDRTHIRVKPSKRKGEGFTNRKETYSLLFQGITDHTGQFIHIELGYTGRNQDAHMFHHSALWEAMEAGQFVPGNPTIPINGVQVGPLILGDGAYPLSPWLMKPYRGGHLDEPKMAYNRVFSACHKVAEDAFGRLKARWGCLAGPLTVAEENFRPVVSACVVLHNICETKGHALHPNLQPPTHVTTGPGDSACRADGGRRAREGERVRSALARKMAG